MIVRAQTQGTFPRPAALGGRGFSRSQSVQRLGFKHSAEGASETQEIRSQESLRKAIGAELERLDSYTYNSVFDYAPSQSAMTVNTFSDMGDVYYREAAQELQVRQGIPTFGNASNGLSRSRKTSTSHFKVQMETALQAYRAQSLLEPGSQAPDLTADLKKVQEELKLKEEVADFLKGQLTQKQATIEEQQKKINSQKSTINQLKKKTGSSEQLDKRIEELKNKHKREIQKMKEKLDIKEKLIDNIRQRFGFQFSAPNSAPASPVPSFFTRKTSYERTETNSVQNANIMRDLREKMDELEDKAVKDKATIHELTEKLGKVDAARIKLVQNFDEDVKNKAEKLSQEKIQTLQNQMAEKVQIIEDLKFLLKTEQVTQKDTLDKLHILAESMLTPEQKSAAKESVNFKENIVEKLAMEMTRLRSTEQQNKELKNAFMEMKAELEQKLGNIHSMEQELAAKSAELLRVEKLLIEVTFAKEDFDAKIQRIEEERDEYKELEKEASEKSMYYRRRYDEMSSEIEQKTIELLEIKSEREIYKTRIHSMEPTESPTQGCFFSPRKSELRVSKSFKELIGLLRSEADLSEKNIPLQLSPLLWRSLSDDEAVIDPPSFATTEEAVVEVLRVFRNELNSAIKQDEVKGWTAQHLRDLASKENPTDDEVKNLFNKRNITQLQNDYRTLKRLVEHRKDEYNNIGVSSLPAELSMSDDLEATTMLVRKLREAVEMRDRYAKCVVEKDEKVKGLNKELKEQKQLVSETERKLVQSEKALSELGNQMHLFLALIRTGSWE